MKHTFLFLASLAALSACNSSPKEEGPDVVFDPNVRYSQRIIDSRINDFYCNTKQVGLSVFDQEGNLLKEGACPDNLKFDYVVGLVTKAVIEAADYYHDQPFARPWFYTVQDYANRFAESVPTVGKSLDDLNASKMYATIYDLTAPGAAFADIADSATHTLAYEAMQKAAIGLADVNTSFSIKPEVSKELAGGWYHKGSYPNQMWCDGQYMGPALLAQLKRYGFGIDGREDYFNITRQFDLTWHKLWNADEQLLLHAFSADPKGEKAQCWADPETGVSAEYWGRACGWYFLALVDVIENMPTDMRRPSTVSTIADGVEDQRTRLKLYLEALARGLAARQDAETGCWYQLLAHDGSFTADTYKGEKYEPLSNYLESSATAIFTAAYLKAIRLGLLDKETYMPVAERAYQGFVNRFVKRLPDGSLTLIDCCASAGLGNKTDRDGSAEYYLLGEDVTRVTTYTEGKVLGAFILAAVEYERSH
ncbi:MAG: glycoside hydrolase family 88 protein [Bacteroidales bacterium]|nr:glycoside hydrolase family 88 protein [Candidatus Liminaster caballi]